jgi:hypothetical protein
VPPPRLDLEEKSTPSNQKPGGLHSSPPVAAQAYAAALTLALVGTEAIVFRICEAIW